jgi:hypothetical protein
MLYKGEKKKEIVKKEDKIRYTPPLPTSVQPISITKTLLIVPTKNERNPANDYLVKFHQIPSYITKIFL